MAPQEECPAYPAGNRPDSRGPGGKKAGQVIARVAAQIPGDNRGRSARMPPIFARQARFPSWRGARKGERGERGTESGRSQEATRTGAPDPRRRPDLAAVGIRGEPAHLARRVRVTLSSTCPAVHCSATATATAAEYAATGAGRSPAGVAQAKVLDLGLQAYRCGEHEGRFRQPVLTVIDYSLPLTEPRLWVIDLDRKVVLYHELVAHGDGSGGTLATAFSNRMGSQSSVGLFAPTRRTGPLRLRVAPLGAGARLDDNAPRARHRRPADSRGEPRVPRTGRNDGHELGLPGVPEEVAPQVIDHIAGGSAVFAYYPDADWLHESHPALRRPARQHARGQLRNGRSRLRHSRSGANRWRRAVFAVAPLRTRTNREGNSRRPRS